MQHLAEFLQIEYNKILLVPTFNGTPISANTSFDENREGILSDTVERHKTLSSKEIEIIEQETGDFYNNVLEQTQRF